jgi:hypothetical protein
MSKISKFIKLDKNILLEYVYNDGNLISEAYDILVNSKDKTQSYMATETSGTGNTQGNQLFRIDAVSGRYGKVNPDYYTFLQTRNYSSAPPIRHDTIKFHLPINWTFGEYLGFYVKVYAYDSLNQKTYDLSNFYFDMTDVSQQYLMNFTSPPLLFQEKLWGKNIKIEIPALSEISTQLEDNRPKENSINANLTNGSGLSLTTPIFIDFHFVNNIQTINGITTYLTDPKITTTITQSPEFEKMGLVIENSENGDFFEIYGTYNDTIGGFKKFIDDSVVQDHRYYVQYNITMYEQNIRGKTTTVTVTDSFNETIEYRPIIKYSTTTAIIDVEMRLIDSVDDSYIIRRASYGMLQDEVSKYSLKLMKINLKNAHKPKIYNIKNAINPSLVGVANSMGVITVDNKINTPQTPPPATAGGLLSGVGGDGTNGNGGNGGNVNGGNVNGNNVIVETVNIPFPVLIDRFNIIGKSENATFDSKNFFGLGKIQILLYPYDNIVKFSIATGTNEKPEYFNLTGFNEIKLAIRNDKNQISFPLFIESGDINLEIGQISFKVTQNKFAEIKRIYTSGINVFYIIGTNQSTTSVIYTGLFKIYDDKSNVNELNNQSDIENAKPSIIPDPSLTQETATVTRKEGIIDESAPKLKPNQLKDLQSKIGNKFNKR